MGLNAIYLSGVEKFVSMNCAMNQHTHVSEFESACQAHNVFGVDLGFKCSQPWQIIPIDIHRRRFGIRVVCVHRRRVIQKQSLRLGNDGKAVDRFRYSCNELVVVASVVPTEVNEHWIRSLAWLASGRGRDG